jgi:hypothetical protein
MTLHRNLGRVLRQSLRRIKPFAVAAAFITDLACGSLSVSKSASIVSSDVLRGVATGH